MFDYLIVGAGFAGSVLAERLASGILTAHRRPKADVTRFAAATKGKRKAVAMDVDPEV